MWFSFRENHASVLRSGIARGATALIERDHDLGIGRRNPRISRHRVLAQIGARIAPTQAGRADPWCAMECEFPGQPPANVGR